jgi:hypothetical protein
MAPVKSEMIGARFKMSALGAARSPIHAGKEGIIIGGTRYSNGVRVQFDSYRSPTAVGLQGLLQG